MNMGSYLVDAESVDTTTETRLGCFSCKKQVFVIMFLLTTEVKQFGLLLLRSGLGLDVKVGVLLGLVLEVVLKRSPWA